MAFPGTYNISYYRGDTLEFRIYPKDNAGNAFSLSGYLPPKFKIATERGSAGTQYEGFATIDTAGYILCAIPPEVGVQLSAGTTYVYDVEIGTNVGEYSYDYRYTVLTGNIVVTEQVNAAPLLVAPDSPTNAVITVNQETASVSISWTPPESGAQVDKYYIAAGIGPTGTPTIITPTGTTSNPFTIPLTALSTLGVVSGDVVYAYVSASNEAGQSAVPASAHFTSPYVVQFNANGGTGTMANQYYSTTHALTTNTFTRSGYTFLGWNAAANGSSIYSFANGANYSFSASIILYAQWSLVV